MTNLPKKEEFEAFVKVQRSGRINMFLASEGAKLAGIDKSTWISIMKNYKTLDEMYPEVNRG